MARAKKASNTAPSRVSSSMSLATISSRMSEFTPRASWAYAALALRRELTWFGRVSSKKPFACQRDPMSCTPWISLFAKMHGWVLTIWNVDFILTCHVWHLYGANRLRSSDSVDPNATLKSCKTHGPVYQMTILKHGQELNQWWFNTYATWWSPSTTLKSMAKWVLYPMLEVIIARLSQ